MENNQFTQRFLAYCSHMGQSPESIQEVDGWGFRFTTWCTQKWDEFFVAHGIVISRGDSAHLDRGLCVSRNQSQFDEWLFKLLEI